MLSLEDLMKQILTYEPRFAKRTLEHFTTLGLIPKPKRAGSGTRLSTRVEYHEDTYPEIYACRQVRHKFNITSAEVTDIRKKGLMLENESALPHIDKQTLIIVEYWLEQKLKMKTKIENDKNNTGVQFDKEHIKKLLIQKIQENGFDGIGYYSMELIDTIINFPLSANEKIILIEWVSENYNELMSNV